MTVQDFLPAHANTADNKEDDFSSNSKHLQRFRRQTYFQDSYNMEDNLSPPFSTLSLCHFTAWTHGHSDPYLKDTQQTRCRKTSGDVGTYFVHAADPAVGEDHAKLRISRFPRSSCQSHILNQLPLNQLCLFPKKLRTVADSGRGLWAADGFPPSSPLPLLPSACNKQYIPAEKPSCPQSSSVDTEDTQLQPGHKSARWK